MNIMLNRTVHNLFTQVVSMTWKKTFGLSKDFSRLKWISYEICM